MEESYIDKNAFAAGAQPGPHWDSSQLSPKTPSWIVGPLRGGGWEGREGKRQEEEGRGGKEMDGKGRRGGEGKVGKGKAGEDDWPCD